MNAKMTQHRFKRSSKFIKTSKDGEPALFDVENCTYFALRGTASDIWDAVEKPASANEICAHLCTIYDVTLEQCMAEVAEWIEQANTFNAITIST